MAKRISHSILGLVVGAFSAVLAGGSVFAESSLPASGPAVVQVGPQLDALDFSKTSLVFIGNSAEEGPESTVVTNIALKVAEAVDRAHPMKRKCLVLEADPVFDEHFKRLSLSPTAETVKEETAKLDTEGMKSVFTQWIGEVYPVRQFEFAKAHGWTVRSGDMHRGDDYWNIIAEGDVDPQWLDYHQMYLRDQYMADRLSDLLKSDCDVVVAFYGAAHLMESKTIEKYHVSYKPVPAMLLDRGLPSVSVIAATPTTADFYKMFKDAPDEQESLKFIRALVTPAADLSE